jgi:amino acid adenylation domain-containing protein
MNKTAQDMEVFAFPASFTQERLWLLDQMEPGNPAYNIAGAIRLRGRLNIPALQNCLNEVVQRHEALRTTFRSIGGQVMQIIGLELDLQLPVTEAEVVSDEDGASAFSEQMSRHALAAASHRFDLSQGPLLRAELVKFGLEDHVLFLVFHHVIADGWSMTILIREVMALYNAFIFGQPSPMVSLEIQYADFTQWQRQSLSEKVLSREIGYWKQKLADLPVLELPCDMARPPVQTHAGARISRWLPDSLAQAAAALCRTEEITLFMLMLAAFKLLLYRYTGNPDVVVGSPVAGRNHSKVENLIGCFLNTLVLRTDYSGNISFRQLLQRVKEVTLDSYSHQDVPFEKLLEELKPERDASRTPFFQVFFNMLNYPSLALELDGLKVEMIELPEMWSKFDLTLYVQEKDGQIRLDFVYKTEIFSAGRISEMLEQLHHLLDQAMHDPDKSIEEFSLVTPGARLVLPDPAAKLNADWMGAVQELFFRHVEKNPDHVAVSDPHVVWNYRQLDDMSNSLASTLLADEIQPGDVVAIYAHRSAPLVVALLGILKAGAAFLILDPAYPAARLIDYLTVANPRGLLQLEAAGPIPEALESYLQTSSCRCRIVLPRSESPDFAVALKQASYNGPRPVVGPDHLAYISFTSGSSGKPKGVLGRHGSLTHFIPWMTEEFTLAASDRFSLFSALSHDPLHRDVFTPLMTGGRVCIPEHDALTTPGKAAEWMLQCGITITNLTPAIGQILLEGRSGNTLTIDSLRYAFFVGDILTRGDVAGFHRIAPKTTFINLYGSTETQRAVSFLRVPSSFYDDSSSGHRLKEILSLGKGMKDVQLLVMNRRQKLAGIGEAGEIYLRSPHLAMGYKDDARLTEEKFLKSWFTEAANDRLYRTGDMGRYLPDGSVESLGRADQQIKIRGFRIELGEIEAALKQHALVRHAAVIAPADGAGSRRIVGYVVLAQKPAGWSQELCALLKERLPVYMVPSALVALDALPLMQNGKLDRKALPLPEAMPADEMISYAAPRTDLERELAGIMKKVLNVPDIGIHDDFFVLGGHSLLAIHFIARLQEALNVKITFQQFFLSPTVAELSITVVQAQALEANESRVRALLSELEGISESPLEMSIGAHSGA